MIHRPDYDPSSKINFVKTGIVDIRKKNDFNSRTNWYDNIRTVNFESQHPDARAYINLP